MVVKHIAYFLDDGLGIEFEVSKFENTSKLVLNNQTKAGFVPNKEKLVWKPAKILTWLDISVNLNNGSLYISMKAFQIY